MNPSSPVTFVSHTNKPGGGELALRRYLEATGLPVRLVTMESGGVWQGLDQAVVHAPDMRRLRAAIREGGLVVANSMRAAALLSATAAPRRTRLVYWVRDGLTDSAMSAAALLLTRTVTAHRVTHYLANSAWTASTVREALHVSSEDVDVVYSMSGVGAGSLARPPRRVPESPLRLLFLGRISPWKAPDVAVQALRALRHLDIEATLTIAGAAHFGEDRYARHLEHLVAQEPDATLVGHVDDVSRLLATHDVLVHCSTVPEPFGQVIVQALGAGCPVVVTNHGGPREIVQPGCGAFVPPRDPVAVAEAVQSLLTDYRRHSAAALHRAADFTDEVACASTDDVLERLLA
ncbi:glycosyltransferase family 4 protein [Ornithinimicrobium sediminis]|uniref:glycosyltransferase family 4 protein n=1 Tax=Ornithinimicrobium sediminis TaxID=2904603 RepID=UPI001E2EE510|nr:glycosyltransferase family 4 protein [Ornithinimicrobium sediminis]